MPTDLRPKCPVLTVSADDQPAEDGAATPAQTGVHALQNALGGGMVSLGGADPNERDASSPQEGMSDP